MTAQVTGHNHTVAHEHQHGRGHLARVCLPGVLLDRGAPALSLLADKSMPAMEASAGRPWRPWDLPDRARGHQLLQVIVVRSTDRWRCW